MNIGSGIVPVSEGVSKGFQEITVARRLRHSLRRLVGQRSYYWFALETVAVKNLPLP